MLFSSFLLFDYYPDIEASSTIIRIPIGSTAETIKVTVTELIVIICVLIYHLGELREVEKLIFYKLKFNYKFLNKL